MIEKDNKIYLSKKESQARIAKRRSKIMPDPANDDKQKINEAAWEFHSKEFTENRTPIKKDGTKTEDSFDDIHTVLTDWKKIIDSEGGACNY